MKEYIDKAVIKTELERRIKVCQDYAKCNLTENTRIGNHAQQLELNDILSFIDTLEVKDPYEQCIQYDSIKAGIQANAEIYSFNIESELFNQLTKEQQALWRKEIEQAYTSGGKTGIEFARDVRYKENLKVKEVDLEKEIQQHINNCLDIKFPTTDIKTIAKDVEYTARKFFELGLKAKGE